MIDKDVRGRALTGAGVWLLSESNESSQVCINKAQRYIAFNIAPNVGFRSHISYSYLGVSVHSMALSWDIGQ